MSATSGSSNNASDKKKQCVTFEPQAWRKTLCKNCFKTRDEHQASAADADSSSSRSALPSRSRSSTPCAERDDVIVIPRRAPTPVNEVVLSREDENLSLRSRGRRSTSPAVQSLKSEVPPEVERSDKTVLPVKNNEKDAAAAKPPPAVTTSATALKQLGKEPARKSAFTPLAQKTKDAVSATSSSPPDTVPAANAASNTNGDVAVTVGDKNTEIKPVLSESEIASGDTQTDRSSSTLEPTDKDTAKADERLKPTTTNEQLPVAITATSSTSTASVAPTSSDPSPNTDLIGADGRETGETGAASVRTGDTQVDINPAAQSLTSSPSATNAAASSGQVMVKVGHEFESSEISAAKPVSVDPAPAVTLADVRTHAPPDAITTGRDGAVAAAADIQQQPPPQQQQQLLQAQDLTKIVGGDCCTTADLVPGAASATAAFSTAVQAIEGVGVEGQQRPELAKERPITEDGATDSAGKGLGENRSEVAAGSGEKELLIASAAGCGTEPYDRGTNGASDTDALARNATEGLLDSTAVASANTASSAVSELNAAVPSSAAVADGCLPGKEPSAAELIPPYHHYPHQQQHQQQNNGEPQPSQAEPGSGDVVTELTSKTPSSLPTLNYLRTSSGSSSASDVENVRRSENSRAPISQIPDDYDDEFWRAARAELNLSISGGSSRNGCAVSGHPPSPSGDDTDHSLTGSGLFSPNERARAEATLVLSDSSQANNVRETSGGIYVVSGADLLQSSSASLARSRVSPEVIETGSRSSDSIKVSGTAGETSLFHHVPAEDSVDAAAGSGRGGSWDVTSPSSTVDSITFSTASGATNRTSPSSSTESSDSNNRASAAAAASRRRRRRILSCDDLTAMDGGNSGTLGSMTSMDMARSEAMMEGTRLLMESLREKVAVLEQKCDQLDREKLALSDLLIAKKSDYDRMKDHCGQTINELEDEVQRLKSEKARLIDRLQLPESERASLAAEENEIAELKRRLEDAEMRYSDALADNEDLRQEVRDLQLAMAELHDQFRDEEMVELRDVQRELEATSKACRIAQFKLRKSERRCEQLEQDKIQAEDKLRSLENCLQGSDDKRRLRLLEDDLRKAKEAAVRLHEDVERADERRQRQQDDLDRVKNLLNESENRRLCLQNQLDSTQSELQKLREQVKFEGRLDLLKPAASLTSSSSTGGSVEMATAVAQLTRDLAASEERENDVREQLKFAEQENKTLRKKLSDSEEELESMSLQLRKLTAAKRASQSSKSSPTSGVSETPKEAELRLQMELAEQEVTVLKRKLDAAVADNENLLTAVKYLREKVEAPAGTSSASISDGVEGSKLDTFQQREKDLLRQLEEAKSKLAKLGDQDRVATLERSLNEEQSKYEKAVKEHQTKEAELTKCKDELQTNLKVANEALEKVRKELETAKKSKDDSKSSSKDGNSKSKLEAAQKQLEELKSQHASVEKELNGCREELKASKDAAGALQKNFDEIKEKYDKILKESGEKDKTSKNGNGSAGSVAASKTDKEPASWRWDKQELERQIKDLKKKVDELSPPAGGGTGSDASRRNSLNKAGIGKLTASADSKAEATNGDCSKCCAEKAELRTKIDQLTQERDAATKEKEEVLSKDKKDAESTTKTKDTAGISGAKSKFSSSFGKEAELNKTIQDLTSKLDKKEAELKTKSTEMKKAQEKIDELQKNLEQQAATATGSKKESTTSEVRKQKEKLEAEVTRLNQELEASKAKIAEYETQKSKLESDLKKANESQATNGKTKKDDTKGVASERDTLAKEKQKLADELSRLKTEYTEAESKRKSERDELEKTCKEKTKLVEKLQKELDTIKATTKNPTSTANAPSSSPSGGVTIPVQHSTSRTIPVQKLSGSSGLKSGDASASSAESEDSAGKLRVKSLEDQMQRLKDQMTSLTNEKDKATKESKKTLDDVKTRYEKELEVWKTDKEQMKKAEKQVEEFRSRISVLDKSVEDLSGKLKSEESKRREAENKVKQLQSTAASSDSKSSSDDKAAPASATSPTTATTPGGSGKLSDFRSKFEKFGSAGTAGSGVSKPGSTPAPVRRLSGSGASGSADAAATQANGGTDSVLAELQRQLADVEKMRVKDRQELTDKIAAQKKEFDTELQELRKRNTQLDSRAQQLTTVQKDVVDLRCQFDSERTVWNTEKTQLQGLVNEALAARDEQQAKAAELAAEVAKLRASSDSSNVETISSAKSAETVDSKSKSSTTSPSIIIPVRRLGEDSKSSTNSTSGAEATASAAASNADNGVSARRSLFTPISQQSKAAAPRESRTIPVTKIGRPPTPRI